MKRGIAHKITPEIEQKFIAVNDYINNLNEKGTINELTKRRMQRYAFTFYDTPEEGIIQMIDRWVDNINNKNKSW